MSAPRGRDRGSKSRLIEHPGCFALGAASRCLSKGAHYSLMFHYFATPRNTIRDIVTLAKDSQMASKETKSSLIGRSAISGKFKSVADARRQPDTSVVERLPKPGYGTSK